MIHLFLSETEEFIYKTASRKTAKGRGVENPIPYLNKKVNNKHLVVKNHENVVITKQLCVVCTPPKERMVHESSKRIERAKLIFEHPTISFIPEVPQESTGCTTHKFFSFSQKAAPI